MTTLRTGTIVHWQNLSPGLAIFRVLPEAGRHFPEYEPGQNINLRREKCQLTKAVGTDAKGKTIYAPDMDEQGNPKLGPVMHSYSIASAPYETKQHGYLEFYLIREKVVGYPGRLTESLFSSDLQKDNKVSYPEKINGRFTLSHRAKQAQHITLIGTGTGLAPFISMIKQLAFDGREGRRDSRQYTLIHTNRTFEELGYHQELQQIEASHVFDFVYIPTVSRPGERDSADRTLGIGRANNLLRMILGMRLKEEEDLQHAVAKGEDINEAKAALEVVIPPALPANVSLERIRQRIHAAHSVILACGNWQAMSDIKTVAVANQIRLEKEDW